MKYYALMKIYSEDEGWCLFGGWDNTSGGIFTDAEKANALYRAEHTYYLKSKHKKHPVELWEVEV